MENAVQLQDSVPYYTHEETVDISTDKTIVMQHYSSVNFYKGALLTKIDRTLSVKIPRQPVNGCFNVGDPVVCGMDYGGGKILIQSCAVKKINIGESTMELEIDKKGFSREKRSYERVCTSFYADVRLKTNSKRYRAIVKDISIYGMQIFTQENLSLNQQIDMDVYMGKELVYLKCRIVRKVECDNRFIYGLSIIYSDNGTRLFMEDYLKRIKMVKQNALEKAILTR